MRLLLTNPIALFQHSVATLKFVYVIGSKYKVPKSVADVTVSNS